MPVLQSRNTNRLQLLMQWNYFKLDENSNASLAMLKELWLMSSNAIQFVLQSRCHNLFCIVARHLTLASCQPPTHPSLIPPTSLPRLSQLLLCYIFESALYISNEIIIQLRTCCLAWPGLALVSCRKQHRDISRAAALPAATSQSRLRPPAVPSPAGLSKLLISQETLVALRERILQ